MKLEQHHIEALREGTKPFMSKEMEDLYKEEGLTDKRYRWDCLWSACRRTPALNDTIHEIYRYANDTHIDTVLRMLAKEAKEAKVLAGTAVFSCGYDIIDQSPVYVGEDPYGNSVYERAQRSCRILNPTRLSHLAQATRRFYPVEGR